MCMHIERNRKASMNGVTPSGQGGTERKYHRFLAATVLGPVERGFSRNPQNP